MFMEPLLETLLINSTVGNAVKDKGDRSTGAPNLKQRIPAFKSTQPSAQTHPVVLGHSRYLLYSFGQRSLFLQRMARRPASTHDTQPFYYTQLKQQREGEPSAKSICINQSA